MTTTQALTETQTHQAKELRKFVRAQQLWFRKCEALSAERKAGVTAGPAYKAWAKGRMPSKAAKHHAYDNGARVSEALGLDRPTTFAELEALVELTLG